MAHRKPRTVDSKQSLIRGPSRPSSVPCRGRTLRNESTSSLKSPSSLKLNRRVSKEDEYNSCGEISRHSFSSDKNARKNIQYTNQRLTPNRSNLHQAPKDAQWLLDKVHSKREKKDPKKPTHQSVNEATNSNFRMRVGVRVRPMFEQETRTMQVLATAHPAHPNSAPYAHELISADQGEPEPLAFIRVSPPGGQPRDYFYDHAFGYDTDNTDVYSALGKQVVDNVLSGISGTLFAYGQTGSGKTHTMGLLGYLDKKSQGLVPLALRDLFSGAQSLSQSGTQCCQITLSFLQIYCETIQDLLIHAYKDTSEEDNLTIRENPQRGFYVEGLKEYVVHNLDEAVALVNIGLENRAMAPTLLNQNSSRSHTVLTLVVERGPMDRSSSHQPQHMKRSKLLLIDLAGSERVRKLTRSSGRAHTNSRLAEARSINTSLSALGNVITALADKNLSHVPFRDSKLTRLLAESLNGRGSTALVATVHPGTSLVQGSKTAAGSEAETLSTLQFASRCMRVQSKPVVEEETDYQELCAQMQDRLSNMEAEFSKRQAAAALQYEKQIAQLHTQLQSFEHQNAPKSNVTKPSMSTVWSPEVGKDDVLGMQEEVPLSISSLCLNVLHSLVSKTVALAREEAQRLQKGTTGLVDDIILYSRQTLNSAVPLNPGKVPPGSMKEVGSAKNYIESLAVAGSQALALLGECMGRATADIDALLEELVSTRAALGRGVADLVAGEQVTSYLRESNAALRKQLYGGRPRGGSSCENSLSPKSVSPPVLFSAPTSERSDSTDGRVRLKTALSEYSLSSATSTLVNESANRKPTTSEQRFFPLDLPQRQSQGKPPPRLSRSPSKSQDEDLSRQGEGHSSALGKFLAANTSSKKHRPDLSSNDPKDFESKMQPPSTHNDNQVRDVPIKTQQNFPKISSQGLGHVKESNGVEKNTIGNELSKPPSSQEDPPQAYENESGNEMILKTLNSSLKRPQSRIKTNFETELPVPVNTSLDNNSLSESQQSEQEEVNLSCNSISSTSSSEDSELFSQIDLIK